MHEPTYRKAMGEAWRLVWHHPVLWVLGILAIFSGQFGISNFVGQMLSLQDSTGDAWRVQGFAITNWTSGAGVVWLAVLVFAMLVAVVLMSVAAQGALITSAAEWYHTRETPDFNGAWHRGVRHFWRLCAVAVLRKGVLMFILIAVGFWAERMMAMWHRGGAVASIVLMTFGLLAGLVVAALAMYTSGYVVTEERSLGQSLGRAWSLFHRHMLVSLEVSLILLVLTVLLIMAVMFTSALTLLPSFLGVVATGVTGATGFMAAGLFVSLTLFIAFIVFVGGFFNAYATSVWMYVFMKMHNEGVGSRVLHWLGRYGR